MRKLYSYDSVAIVTSASTLRSMAERMRATLHYMGSKEKPSGVVLVIAEILLRVLYAARALILGGRVIKHVHYTRNRESRYSPSSL